MRSVLERPGDLMWVSFTVLSHFSFHNLALSLGYEQSWFISNERKRDVFYVFQNYRSCFVDNSEKLGDLDQPYEIMNRSSMNYLSFSLEHSAIYVFNVKIVDPKYRCLSLSF